MQVPTLFLASGRKLILSPKRIVLVLTQDDGQNLKNKLFQIIQTSVMMTSVKLMFVHVHVNMSVVEYATE